jgi:hypothetical protein
MAVFDPALHRDLLFERDRLSELLDRINHKNRVKIEGEAKALAAAYKGHGRPRRPRRVSQEDQARQIQYRAQLDVIDTALQSEAMASPQLFEKCLLELLRAQISYRGPRARAYRRWRDRKIESLLGRLTIGKQTISTRQPWCEEKVRQHLETMLKLRKEAVLQLERFPLEGPEYRGKLSDAQAAVHAVERFLYSQHLASRALFIRRADIIAYEPGPLEGVIVTADAKRAWQLAVTELVEHLKLMFLEPPRSAEDVNSKRGCSAKEALDAGGIEA